MLFALGMIVGAVIGVIAAGLVCAAGKDSISGWGNSCNGDCNQGRDCNCVNKKEQ
jgi:hypothetical protein